MVANKTAALNIRIHPFVKEAARIAADKQHRSVASFIEVLIREHCESEGIPIPEQGSLLDED